MRVGFKVLRNGQPARGVQILPMLSLITGFTFLLVELRTDTNSEWFGMVPLAI